MGHNGSGYDFGVDNSAGIVRIEIRFVKGTNFSKIGQSHAEL